MKKQNTELITDIFKNTAITFALVFIEFLVVTPVSVLFGRVTFSQIFASISYLSEIYLIISLIFSVIVVFNTVRLHRKSMSQ